MTPPLVHLHPMGNTEMIIAPDEQAAYTVACHKCVNVCMNG